MIHTDNQNSDLTQSAEHLTDDLEIASSNPTGGNF